jgi:Xaa-Pro aminopeptidase
MKKSILSTIGLFLMFFSLFINPSFAQEFDKEIYETRRQKLMENIKAGFVVIKNSDEQIRSNGENYFPYKVNCDFYYLTGYKDPEAILILHPEGKNKFIMFVKPKNAFSSQWFGDVPGIEGAMDVYGADTAFAYSEFENKVREFLYSNEKIYYDFYNKQLKETLEPLLQKTNGYGPREIVNISPIVHEMRLVKDEHEISLIRKAVDITCEAQLEAIKAIEPGMFEYEIGAIFSYVFEKNGTTKGFAPIIASGSNATVYHYSGSKGQLQSGDLLMMDMGAEYMDYTADITRVVPVNGRYTLEQKEVYEIVLLMEEAVIAHMQPGNNIADCYKKAENIAKDGLFRLGLITDKNTTWQHLLYYFPYIGHPIGLDVHDVGNTENLILEPGMVFAIEPLIYIGDNLIAAFSVIVQKFYHIPEAEVDSFLASIKPVFEKYKGIAARVEDDILITETGSEVLSSKLPKTVKEIEKVMSQKSFFNRKY